MEMTRLAVRSDADIGHVRRTTEALAREVGFHDTALAELAIVATELATNLIHHQAVNGQIILARFDNGEERGIEIISSDEGPGISDPQAAVADGCSSRRSMGCGLGAARRLMDSFALAANEPSGPTGGGQNGSPRHGTLITSRKLVRSASPTRKFVVSAYSRPCSGETANGDAFFTSEEDDGILVAVCDGLGHGPEAEAASRRVIETVKEIPTMAFDDLFQTIDKSLRRTRGAAVSLMRIDLRERILVHAGIGNVQARIYPSGAQVPVAKPGVVGFGPAPRPRVQRLDWPEGGLLAVFSDGISGGWSREDIEPPSGKTLVEAGHEILCQFGRHYDDATLVLVKERP